MNSETLSLVFYKSSDAAFYMRLLAPLIPVMYCDMSVDGMLKGLDQQLSYMKYNIIDAASCVALVYFLVPLMGVKGYIFVIYFSEILNFALSFRRLAVVADVEVDFFRDFESPLLCIAGTAVFIKVYDSVFSFGISETHMLITKIILCGIFYFIMLRATGAVNKEETQWFLKLIKK